MITFATLFLGLTWGTQPIEVVAPAPAARIELLLDGVAVANGSSFGKGMRVAPAAVPDDGLADVVLVRPIRGALVPFKLPRLYTGGALAIREVIWKRARRVRLEPAAGADIGCLEIDGETIPGGAADFELLPGALPFLR